MKQYSLPQRDPYSHKGDYGLAVIIGGCRGMSGAISLAGKASLTSGAGLVRLAVPDAIVETVASYAPEAMTLPLPNDLSGRTSLDAFEPILRAVKPANAVALGPGLGQSLGLTALVIKLYNNVDKPMVVDADALNALSQRCLDKNYGSRYPRVLSPHPGEFSRLIGRPTPSERTNVEQQERVKAAEFFAEKNGVILILKGHHSIITDGANTEINQTGNPGMATGGSGDVLTGIITAFIARGVTPFEAAVLGVKIHGVAGDIAAEKSGMESLTAGSIIESLPQAFVKYSMPS